MENEVKQDIVDWISKPENEELLQTLMLMKKNASDGDWVDDLKEHEKSSLHRGIENHKKNKTLTSEEFWDRHA
ncbi:MAG: hypothetical protein GVY02_08910 [Bacteroidetes bacterium]|jgi:hypothetical protein|nr:hypothetical protein [Bacteroidota bacterium]